ncbi:hypothetical protein INT47_009196 [Mucor saturninus]|uniref:Myb-like domain-containing protein n=1 Tax=Mucor saturninus TaxID=64648 RepID=A0A8H7RNQ6_9FUNG|nr:hypothetical protein INT47_009196 [Mucor saturninus]
MSVAKPRSMPAGARNVLRSNDSASLWNCTLSPGWTEEESEILRKALMKFGVGNWAKIIDSGCLPGKTNAQMNLQLQRLLGQQSTAEFASLHIDPKVVGAKNALIQGPGIRRKNNCIVNTGNKLSREELKNRVMANREAYQLHESEYRDIVLPKVPMATLEIKRESLGRLNLELQKVRQIIMSIGEAHPSRIDKFKSDLASTSPKTPGTPTPGSPIPTTPDTPEVEMQPSEDQDLLLAIALQKEEDELVDMLDPDSDEEVEDFTHAKKRKVTRDDEPIKRKIVIVGDGACGKTSLLSRFSRGKFPQDIIVDDKPVVAELWDTAGQEDYDRLRTLSYPDSDVVLIAFSVDIPESLENITEKWMPEVKRFCPGLPLLLVGCKIDLRDQTQVLQELEKQDLQPVTYQQGLAVAREIGAYKYVECSALTGQGVPEVFNSAIRSTIKKSSSCNIINH